MYWTRVISVQKDVSELNQRWSLTSDLIECLRAIQEIDQTNVESLLPIFDPLDFTRRNTTLTLEEFKLADKDLEKWAIVGSSI